jgi:hypothetical protein
VLGIGRPSVDATRSGPENVNPPYGDHRHGNEQINKPMLGDPQVISVTSRLDHGQTITVKMKVLPIASQLLVDAR